jgi:hypothetical protein
LLNDSIINIFLTNIQQTRLIGVIYPPINNQNNLCRDFESMERSEGVNGDGIFDTIDIRTFITKVTSYDLSNFVAHLVLIRFLLNINKIEDKILANYQTDIFYKTIDQNLRNLLKEKNFFSSKSIYN